MTQKSTVWTSAKRDSGNTAILFVPSAFISKLLFSNIYFQVACQTISWQHSNKYMWMTLLASELSYYFIPSILT